MAKSTLRGIIAVVGVVIISVIMLIVTADRLDIAMILSILLSTIFLGIVFRKDIDEKIKNNNSVTLTKEEYERYCKISKDNDKFAK